MKQKVEAEGGELVLRNSHGDIAIIPAKYKLEVEDMVNGKCYRCIDNLVSTLPSLSNYAQDGNILPNQINENENNKSNENIKPLNFNEAFRQARDTLGKNNIFEYKGQIYGTNLKGEPFNPSEELIIKYNLNRSLLNKKEEVVDKIAKTKTINNIPEFKESPAPSRGLPYEFGKIPNKPSIPKPISPSNTYKKTISKDESNIEPAIPEFREESSPVITSDYEFGKIKQDSKPIKPIVTSKTTPKFNEKPSPVESNYEFGKIKQDSKPISKTIIKKPTFQEIVKNPSLIREKESVTNNKVNLPLPKGFQKTSTPTVTINKNLPKVTSEYKPPPITEFKEKPSGVISKGYEFGKIKQNLISVAPIPEFNGEPMPAYSLWDKKLTDIQKSQAVQEYKNKPEEYKSKFTADAQFIFDHEQVYNKKPYVLIDKPTATLYVIENGVIKSNTTVFLGTTIGDKYPHKDIFKSGDKTRYYVTPSGRHETKPSIPDEVTKRVYDNKFRDYFEIENSNAMLAIHIVYKPEANYITNVINNPNSSKRGSRGCVNIPNEFWDMYLSNLMNDDFPIIITRDDQSQDISSAIDKLRVLKGGHYKPSPKIYDVVKPTPSDV
jgi:hypothetical protein